MNYGLSFIVLIFVASLAQAGEEVIGQAKLTRSGPTKISGLNFEDEYPVMINKDKSNKAFVRITGKTDSQRGFKYGDMSLLEQASVRGEREFSIDIPFDSDTVDFEIRAIGTTGKIYPEKLTLSKEEGKKKEVTKSMPKVESQAEFEAGSAPKKGQPGDIMVLEKVGKKWRPKAEQPPRAPASN